MQLLAICAVFLACSAGYRILVLHPASTGVYDTYVGEVCAALQLTLSCVEMRGIVETEVEKTLATLEPHVVLDMSENFTIGLFLSLQATEQTFVHVYSLRQALHGARSVPLYISHEDIEEFVRQVFSHFAWTKAVAVGSPDPLSVQLTQDMIEISSDIVAYFLSPELDLASMQRTLAQAVKATGRNHVLISSRPDLTLRILRSARQRFMMTEGYAYFILEHALPDENWLQEFDGVFFLSLWRSCRSATRKSQFLGYLQTCFARPLHEVLRFLQSQQSAPSIYMFNTQNGTAVLFSTLENGDISFQNATVLFPGPTITPPSGTLRLHIAISNSTQNPTVGPSVDLQSTVTASLLAVKDVNTKLDLLPNFELTWTGLEYGCTEFSETWAAPRLKPLLPQLGSAVVNSPSPITAVGLMKLLQDWLSPKPVVGGSGSLGSLSSPTDFPYYIRISLPDQRLATVYCQIIKYYGWRHIAMLYDATNPSNVNLYTIIKKVAESVGIEIENAEEDRVYNGEKSSEDLVNAILATKVRVMMFLLSDSGANDILKTMYHLGVRRGDLLFFCTWLDIDLITDFSGEDAAIHKELLLGSVKPSPLNFRGAFGRSVYQSMCSIGMVPRFNDCQYYDTILTVAEALRLLVQKGENYENADVMMAELRKTKFTGCSGLVYLQDGTNDRARMAFQVLNLQHDQKNDTWKMQKVLVFDPESTQLFQLTSQVIWPDGTSETPTDIIPPTACPDEKHLSPFANGERLVIAVCFALLAIIAIVTAYIWRRWWPVRFPKLRNKHEMSIADFLVFAGMGIELLQVVGMGPDVSDITGVVEYLAESVSLNFREIVVRQQGMYWVFLDCIFGSCLLWLVLLACTFFRVFDRVALPSVANLAEWWLPLVGDTAFLPIVSQLMEVFMCDRAYHSTFLTSVLARDCHYTCWGLTHGFYVAGCSVVLLVWVPLAVFTRPLWQELQPLLHVQTQPVHKLLSTVFQVALVVINKTIKRSYAFAHMGIYAGTIAAMAIWSCCFKPHTYGRANLWQTGCYCAALWVGVIVIIGEVTHLFLAAGVLLLVGWLGILAVCLVLQVTVFESLLYRKHRADLQNLFRFAFTFKPNVNMENIEFNKPNTVREALQTTSGHQREFSFAAGCEEPVGCEPILS